MKRIYRDQFKLEGFVNWETNYRQTNLFVKACKDLKFEVFEIVKESWRKLTSYIERNRDFLTSLNPIKFDKSAPTIAKRMIRASTKAQVGPMASVAGAIAEEVGRYILRQCEECVVENGGDVFLKLKSDPLIGIYTENPYFKDRLSIKLPRFESPIGVCSSSSKIGPSLSFGKADLAVIIDYDTPFADALATKTANMIQWSKDVERAVEFAKSKDVIGCLFIKDKTIGVWGNIELV